MDSGVPVATNPSSVPSRSSVNVMFVASATALSLLITNCSVTVPPAGTGSFVNSFEIDRPATSRSSLATVPCVVTPWTVAVTLLVSFV